MPPKKAVANIPEKYIRKPSKKDPEYHAKFNQWRELYRADSKTTTCNYKLLAKCWSVPSLIHAKIHAAEQNGGKNLMIYVGEIDGRDILLNRSSANDICRFMQEKTLQMTEFHKATSKKPSAQAQPESLRGTFSPVYFGDAIDELINAADLGTYEENGKVYDVRARLSKTLSEKYALRILLMNIHNLCDYVNRLKVLRGEKPVDFVTSAFASDIPALLDDSNPKQLNTENLNTFEMIKRKSPKFDEKNIKFADHARIVAFSCFSAKTLEPALHNIKNEEDHATFQKVLDTLKGVSEDPTSQMAKDMISDYEVIKKAKDWIKVEIAKLEPKKEPAPKAV